MSALKPLKLTEDERDLLMELAQSEKLELIEKIGRFILSRQANRVLTYHLSSGPEQLVIEKARYEGADSLFEALLSEINRSLDAKKT